MADNKPGSWITIKDLAKMADVSTSTISRALADNPLIAQETRQRIQKLAQEVGFVLNQSASALRSQQSRVISVIIALQHENDQHLDDPFMMTMLASLADALTDQGYDMLLRKVQTHEDLWLEKVRRTHRPAGIILIGQSLEHDEINRAASNGCPIIAWGAKLPGQHYPTVGSDNYRGGQMATRHLAQQGYRHIAFLGDRSLPEVGQRYGGYRDALAESGLPLDPQLYVKSGFKPEHAFEAAQSLFTRDRPCDSVVAASDVIAVNAIRAAVGAGLSVPKQFGVVGFDNVPQSAYSNPPLTTVAQDIRHGANLLAQGVHAMIGGHHVDAVELPCQLIVRKSSERAT